MKFCKEEISGAKRIRYMFSLGKSEAMILLALLNKAITYMPRTILTKTTEMRMRNMAREIGKAIPELTTDPNDDYVLAYKDKD